MSGQRYRLYGTTSRKFVDVFGAVWVRPEVCCTRRSVECAGRALQFPLRVFRFPLGRGLKSKDSPDQTLHTDLLTMT